MIPPEIDLALSIVVISALVAMVIYLGYHLLVTWGDDWKHTGFGIFLFGILILGILLHVTLLV